MRKVKTPLLKIIWNAFWKISFRLTSLFTNHGNLVIIFTDKETCLINLKTCRANVVLNNKNDDQLKPDWIAYVKPWFKKLNIIACEVKPPSKVGRGDISDYVKLAIEMKDMLDELMNAGVASASVLGILVEGK